MYKYKPQETRVESYHYQVTLRILLALRALWYGDLGRGMQGKLSWSSLAWGLHLFGRAGALPEAPMPTDCRVCQGQLLVCANLTAGVDSKTFGIDPKSCGIDPIWEGCGEFKVVFPADQWFHQDMGSKLLGQLPSLLGSESFPCPGQAPLPLCLKAPKMSFWKWETEKGAGGCCERGQGITAEWPQRWAELSSIRAWEPGTHPCLFSGRQ